MSDQDEPGLSELERQLTGAFASTRPRRGFEDELWTRLEARQPWPRRLARTLNGIRWPAIGGAVGVLLVGLLLVASLRLFAGGPRGAATSASAPERSSTGVSSVPAPSVARPGSLAPQPATLPLPTAAGVPQVLANGTLSPLPGAGGSALGPVSSAPQQDRLTLPVYRFAPASGPADGTIVEQGSLPAGLTSVDYPARSAADARAQAAAASDNSHGFTLPRARLVYVAVVSGGQGYLEPAYLFTGTAMVGGVTVPAQLLEPALSASAYG